MDRERFLPTQRGDLDRRGWDGVDVLLISGDAYVDHPSFGIAVIGRVLEAAGFRVGIIAQPDPRDPSSVARLGRPHLLVGISAGVVDSMLANHTPFRRPRRADDYSPGGRGGVRPDRASIVYAHLARRAFPGVPIVLGGVEASLRRFAHYDVWEGRIRRSILLDARAALVVYGEGERAISEVARRIRAAGGSAGEGALWGIPGTAVEGPKDLLSCMIDAAADDLPLEGRPRPRSLLADREIPCDVRELPGPDAIAADPDRLIDATRAILEESHPGSGAILVEPNGPRVVVAYPRARYLDGEELDAVHELPFARAAHPDYREPIPALEPVRFSIIAERGCFGGCTFCAITAHQGKTVRSRTPDSVLREIRSLSALDGFRGVVTDIGGPTANLYGMGCESPAREARCRRISCLWPARCPFLRADHGPYIDLLRRARAAPGIRHVFVRSGIRHDLALESPAFIRELAAHHTGGHLKVAPEHVVRSILDRMAKPPIEVLDRFREAFDAASRAAGKEQYLVPYLIAAFPSSTCDDMRAVAAWLRERHLRVEQVQTFLASPMTLAAAMACAGKDWRTGESIHVARAERELRQQTEIIRPPARRPPRRRRRRRST
ncbi:MAG: YgiQ family radical SAM protein [Planctomycetes bacterium]|nr:YgiQ family radical SAM protein [Planctomycetota bacterium]